ncbi:MAG TPA: hypothetical protein VGH87_26825, partial [Polyangiaceae bacterium]
MDIRSARTRVGAYRTTNVTTDYGLVARASPFLECLGDAGRSSLTLVLEGQGRFDERGRRGWLRAGEFVSSDTKERGTEAYGGAATTEWMVIEWHDELSHRPFRGRFRIESLSRRDTTRMRDIAHAMLREAKVEHAIAVL